MNPNQSIKILIVKLAGIGDVVMALSIITAIDEKYPTAEITWIGGKVVEPILKAVERIDELIVVDEDALLTGNLIQRAIEVIKIWGKLIKKKYDLVLTCYRDKRYKIISFPIRKKLYKDLSGKDRTTSIVPGRYHAVEYARMIHEKDDSQITCTSFPRLNLTANLEIEKIIQDIPFPRIILAPGGSKNVLREDNLRRWPINYYSELAQKLIEQKCSIIIVGAKSDEWLMQEFDSIGVYNLIGRTTLIDLIKVFDNSDLLICHDTGVFHLAKLSGIKVIGFFGPVNPKERVGINENVTALWGGVNLSCAPCYDGKNFSKCEDVICMKSISVLDVFEKVVEYITNKHKFS